MANRISAGTRQWGETCPYCGTKAVIHVDGKAVCMSCGTVIEDHPIDNTPGRSKDEEPARISPELIHRWKDFHNRHREAHEWASKYEESLKNTNHSEAAMKAPEKPKAGTTVSVGEGYVKALARALVSNGIIQDMGRAEIFAKMLAGQLEHKAREYGTEVPTIERVIKVLECMFYGVPNTKDCEQTSPIVDAIKKALNTTYYHEDFIMYVARAKFGREPNDELIQKAEYYLRKLDEWIKSQGIGRGGISEYPSMPIVAAAALAIAVIETNNPRSVIKALSKGNTKSIITRLRLNEFINWLGKP